MLNYYARMRMIQIFGHNDPSCIHSHTHKYQYCNASLISWIGRSIHLLNSSFVCCTSLQEVEYVFPDITNTDAPTAIVCIVHLLAQGCPPRNARYLGSQYPNISHKYSHIIFPVFIHCIVYALAPYSSLVPWTYSRNSYEKRKQQA